MRKIILILLACLLAAILVIPASAQESDPPTAEAEVWTNTEVELHADLGPVVDGLTPGENGYKIFNPGAIKIVSVQPTNGDITPFYTRRGYTDVWGIWQGPFQDWKFTGSHTSESSFVENKIWADGFLKYKSQTGWQTKCSNRLRSSRAHCNTTFSGWYSKVFAQTLHHFETKGYSTWDVTTQDAW